MGGKGGGKQRRQRRKRYVHQSGEARLRYCGTREVACNTINQRPSRFSYTLVVKAMKLTASPFLNLPCTLSIPITHPMFCARWTCGSFIDTEISAKRSK